MSKEKESIAEAEKLREDILSKLKEVEQKIKAVQKKLNDKGVPDIKEDFLSFKDILK